MCVYAYIYIHTYIYTYINMLSIYIAFFLSLYQHGGSQQGTPQFMSRKINNREKKNLNLSFYLKHISL